MAAITSRILLQGEFAVFKNEDPSMVVKTSSLNSSLLMTLHSADKKLAIAIHLDSHASIPVCLDILNKSLYENHQTSLYTAKFKAKIAVLENDPLSHQSIQLIKKQFKLMNIPIEIGSIQSGNPQMIFSPLCGKITIEGTSCQNIERLQQKEIESWRLKQNNGLGDFEGSPLPYFEIKEKKALDISQDNERVPVKELDELISKMRILMKEIEMSHESQVRSRIIYLKEALDQNDLQKVFDEALHDESYFSLLQFILYNQYALRLEGLLKNKSVYIQDAKLFKNQKAQNLIESFLAEDPKKIPLTKSSDRIISRPQTSASGGTSSLPIDIPT